MLLMIMVRRASVDDQDDDDDDADDDDDDDDDDDGDDDDNDDGADGDDGLVDLDNERAGCLFEAVLLARRRFFALGGLTIASAHVCKRPVSMLRL
jgi:hypothetical protein